MTIGKLLEMGRRALMGFSDAPDIDADYLLLHVVGLGDRSQLLVHDQDTVADSYITAYQALLEKRQQGWPLAYLLESAEFYGRRFAVTPDVLIPRPETENLIQAARRVIPSLSRQKGRPLRVADMGTGSGCIAITLALELTDYVSTILATDISALALAVARKNADRYGVHSIEFIEHDMLAGLPDAHIDLIISNPPYVPSRELEAEPTILTKGLAFEPYVALDGGMGGSRFTDALRSYGKPLIMEVTGGRVEVVL